MKHSQKPVALFCTSGIVQYAESVEAMLSVYNAKNQNYEVRTTDTGNLVLWHKGDARAIGTFQDHPMNL